MTQDEIERMARDMLHAYGVHTEPYTRGGGDHPIMAPLTKVLRRAFNAGLESGAAEAIRIWKEAPNERTDSALTSYRQNALGEGCTESAKAIRALKLPE